MSKVREHMTTKIVSASSSDSVQNIAKIMKKKRISAILIIDDDRLVGIVTERDFVSKVVADCLDPKTITAKDVMSSDIISGDPEMNIIKAATLMTEHKIKKLPVIDDGHLVGLVTQTDLMKLLSYK